tara:strand:- start:478 stop:1023 length:546 start_codon:yes stop_codon:yes gene_type:complete
MKKYGIIDKTLSKVVYTYNSNRIKVTTEYSSDNFHHFEIESGKYHQGYYWDDGLLYDETYIPSTQMPRSIARNAVIDAMEFGINLINDFAAENVEMGITQMGKTADVLSIMEERVEIDPINKPGVKISIMGTISSGSLYESVVVIDYHIQKANNGDYDSLVPFITPTRLAEFKQIILDHLS